MPLDWWGGTGRESVADLIARKKYARAIELLRAQVLAQPGNTALRLQLADLLVLGGRPRAAVPILIGLADDFAADGFVARAVAALRRVAKIEPGRADIEARLKGLQEPRSTPRLPLQRPSTRRAAPAPGSESAASPAQDQPEAPPGVPSDPEALVGAASGAEDPSGTLTAAAVADAATSPAAAPLEESAIEGSGAGGFTARIRGALRRVLSALPGNAPAATLAEHLEAAGEPPQAEATEPGPASGSDFSDDVSTADGEAAADAAAASSPDATRAAPGLPNQDTNPGVPLAGAQGDDTNPNLLLPGEREDAPLAWRPASPALDFASLPQDAFDDRVSGLIEGLLQGGGGARAGDQRLDALAQAAASSPGELGLTGLMFDDLDAQERLAVLRGLSLRTFEPGDILVSETEAAGGLYLLTAGAVRAFARDEKGRSRIQGRLEEGDFFGEIASLAGLPRSATVVAAASGEMLELHQASLDHIAEQHPRVWARMHAFARERAASRELSLSDGAGRGGPGEALDNHWGPRLRLRLAEAFLRAGKLQEAVQILIDLADEAVRLGQHDKAVALLKKVDEARKRPVGVRSRRAARGAGAAPAKARREVASAYRLEQWVLGIVKDTVRRSSPREETEDRASTERKPDTETLRAYAGLQQSPLFLGLAHEELLSLVQPLPFETYEPGEIVLSEGETPKSVLVVAAGRVKLFARGPAGRDEPVRELREGALLGGLGTFSGEPAKATVTAATGVALLRLDGPAILGICRAHPAARTVLAGLGPAGPSLPGETRSRPGNPQGD